jgi:hypothetical protein
MNTFKIQKKSGTYAELLEAYGLANLLQKISDTKNLDMKISLVANEDSSYEVRLDKPLPDNALDKIDYFPLFKYIKQEANSDVHQYVDYYDYPTEKRWKKEKDDRLTKIYKESKGQERKREIERIETIFTTQKPISQEYDVIAQIITPNNFPGFNKLYQNFHTNKDFFVQFIREILNYYADISYNGKELEKLIKSLSFSKTVTAIQLYNPSQGQGVNKRKADGLNRKNFDSLWICETMKISGALSDMICQLVKVGTSYDLKVFVPEYKEVRYQFKSKLIPDFKKRLKGNTPIKIDVLNILLLTQMIIKHAGYMGLRRKKVKNIVSGLHSVYQKDLGNNKAVVNIGFIQVPNFIEISNREENEAWIELLEEQKKIIDGISELGSTTQGLMLYRNFISGGNIKSFFRFIHWYAIHLSMSNKKYVRPFSIETLNKFYYSMDTPELRLLEIITNDGFKAVAKAIRKSTVSLQYTPKENRKYEVRYGTAQTLQNKSKSKEDLATYVGEFITLYNAETAREAEKTGNSLRRHIRDNELGAFYALLDKFPAKLVGALLASYGFALPAKDIVNAATDDSDTQMESES